MKVSTISYMERKNCGNYEHQEFTVSAVLNETDVVETCLAALKALTHKALYTDTIAQEFPVNVEADVKGLQEAAAKVEAEKKAKEEASKKAEAAAAKKEAAAKAAAEKKAKEDVAKEEKKVPAAVKYSNTDKHPTKAALAGFLAKTYGETWKTKAGLKDFSASLNGQDMMDDKGQILDSFKATVSAFFGEESTGVL